MIPAVPWRVVDLVVENYPTFYVRFVDGVEGRVSFRPSAMRGVFEKLRDPGFFGQAFIQYGVVTWPGELDLAPDAMHDEIKAKGEWILV